MSIAVQIQSPGCQTPHIDRTAVFIAFFIFSSHAVLSVLVAFPWAYRDEACFLINAASLMGYVTQSANSCAIGYSLLLAPLFGIFGNPDHIFLVATILNAFLAAMLFLSLYSFLKMLPTKSNVAIIVASTVSLYAPIWVYANHAMSETLLALVFALSIQCLAAGLGGKSRNMLFFAALVGFIPSIHYRAIPVAVVAWGVLLVGLYSETIERRRYWHCMAISVVVAIGGCVAKVFSRSRLLVIGNVSDESYLLEANRILESLISLDAIRLLLGSVAGQTFYLGLASFGFTIIGVILIIRYLRIGGFGPKSNLVLYYILLSFGGCFVVSCLQKINGGLQDQFIFGRYNDAFSLPVMALGLVFFLDNTADTRKRSVFIAVLAIALAGIVLWATRGHELQAIQGSRIRYFNISGISVAVYALGGVSIKGLLVYGISLTVALAILYCRAPKQFFLLFGIVLLLNAGFAVYLSKEDGLRRRNAPGMDKYSKSNIVQLLRTHESPIVAALESYPCNRCINYELASENLWFKWHYRWQLFNWTLLPSPNSSSNLTSSPLTILGQKNSVLNGRILTREKGVDQCLIVFPGKADERLMAYSIGNIIDFSRDGNSFRYKLKGWAAPEETGTPMEGSEACLALRHTPGSVELKLIASMYFPDNFSGVLVVQIDGKHAASWTPLGRGSFLGSISGLHLEKAQTNLCFHIAGEPGSASLKHLPVFKYVQLISDEESQLQ